MPNHPNRNKNIPQLNPSPCEVVELRKHHGLTQAQAAEKWMSTLRTVQTWEAPAGSDAHRRCHPLMWWAMQRILENED